MKIKLLTMQLLLLFWGCSFVFSSAFAQTCTMDDDMSTRTDSSSPVLNLEQAIDWVLTYNPDLQVSAFKTRVAESDKTKASLFVNPELEFEYEDFDSPEKTLSIGYLIELGGKRRHRIKQADAGIELATAELNASRIELVHETAAAFIDVMAAKKSLHIAIEKQNLADQVYQTSKERVLAGRVSPMEQMTAQIKYNNARLDVQTAENVLLTTRTTLSALWGGSPNNFSSVIGNFDRIQPVPAFETIKNYMEDSPHIRTHYAEIKVAESTLALEKRNRIPDLFLSGGIKRTDESDDDTYIAAISLPLPIFDRNQAEVSRTAAELDQQTAMLSAEKKRLAANLHIAFQTLKTAQVQAHAVKNVILPAAQSVFDGVKEGYEEGEFGFLDMLEAQTTLYESQESYVQFLSQYHHAVIALEKMLGKDLSGFRAN